MNLDDQLRLMKALLQPVILFAQLLILHKERIPGRDFPPSFFGIQAQKGAFFPLPTPGCQVGGIKTLYTNLTGGRCLTYIGTEGRRPVLVNKNNHQKQ